VLYFTSRRLLDERSKRNPFDNKYYEDIYFSRYDSGQWTVAQRMEEPVNPRTNKTNNAAVALSSDDKSMYLYDGHKNAGDIMVSHNPSGYWSKPKPVKGKINTNHAKPRFALPGMAIPCI